MDLDEARTQASSPVPSKGKGGEGALYTVINHIRYDENRRRHQDESEKKRRKEEKKHAVQISPKRDAVQIMY